MISDTSDSPRQRVAGIVLCGGKSSRMGRPKASLPFGPETMLEHVVGTLLEVVAPIVVVAAREQQLPPLPADVLIARDEHEALGPLAGLAAGLAALPEDVEAAYVSSCDVPFLRPAFVGRIIDRLGDRELAIPRDGKFHHPLAAVYRKSLLPRVRRLLADERLRPLFLVEESNSAIVEVDELRDVDPELESLRNLNTPEEYAAALERAGFGVDSE
ncbi:MAG: molybdenum cofactor guanylyltransferase [Planctomycetaceae bacterium]